MTELELKAHLDFAEQSPKHIALAVAGLSDKVLRWKPAPDKWCILEVVGHLADSEIVFAYRLRQLLADKKPVIAPIDQDDWANNLGYLKTPMPEMIALYGLNRHANSRLLRNLKSVDLEKSAFHPELNGNISVANIAAKLDVHSVGHLAQIERLKSAAVRTS
ncbi:MAG: DinB family protein [Acidobacteriaceae bacterium]